jgi:hypothetical protein
MAMTKNFSDPQFISRPAKDGKSWSVFCELGYRRPVEIPDFPSEKAAQYWIDAASKKWLEKFAAGSLGPSPAPPANDRNEIEKAKALQKLLDMATERWPPPWDGLVPALEHFQRSKPLMEMWPEACRRAGARALEFPRELIEQWQKGTGSKRPS